MSYTYTLTTRIPASPKAVYDTWLDSRGHSAMTGGTATQSGKIGAEVTAWGDYISGRNLHLVPGKRIVQTWRTTQFTDADTDSIITVTLRKAPGGTWLTLNHANVPEDQTSYESSGWQTHYFEPMQRYFLTMSNVAAVIARTKKQASKGKSGARKTGIATSGKPAKTAAAKKKSTAKAAASGSSRKPAAKRKAKAARTTARKAAPRKSAKAAVKASAAKKAARKTSAKKASAKKVSAKKAARKSGTKKRKSTR